MSERTAFNVRLRIEADTTSDVWYLLYVTLENLREVSPEGVEVGWASMRPARRSPGWEVTMEPKPRRKAKRRRSPPQSIVYGLDIFLGRV